MVETLIKNGADVNLSDGVKYTLLHRAALYSNFLEYFWFELFDSIYVHFRS